MNEKNNSEYYFCELINVIKFCHRTAKYLTNNGRHSDAYVYIISGECDYNFADGSNFTAKKGDVLFLVQDASYEMHIKSEEYEFIYCDFRISGEEKRQCTRYSPKDITTVDNLFRHLYRCFSKPDVNYFSECMADLYRIQSIVISSIKKANQNINDKISHAAAYIDTNYSDCNLSVSSLAEMSEMSEVYFRKLFAKTFNISPIKYITFRRIEKAKALLEYSFMTVSECASLCGFESGQYFSRVFKKHMGMSPCEYRGKN